jgi:hypothetical protein
MGLRVVGAGVGRTGTMSLKTALERLLGAPCYHMVEVFSHPQHVPVWHAAARGEMPDWQQLFAGYAAAVDWPAASFWPEISAAFPDAIVVLSLRERRKWWQSADETIFPALRDPQAMPLPGWHAMIEEIVRSRFTAALDDAEAAMAAFDRHNAAVRAAVPASRLIEWQAADGWQPLCAALGLPVPDEPFPRVNTREEFAAMRGAAKRP